MPIFDFLTGLILLIAALTIPGYALSLGFFPGKKDLDELERLTFSFAFSVAFVPLVTLIEMQVLGWLLTAGLAWSNFIGLTVLGLTIWAIRTQKIESPKSLHKILKPVKKGDGVPLFFEKWMK